MTDEHAKSCQHIANADNGSIVHATTTPRQPNECCDSIRGQLTRLAEANPGEEQQLQCPTCGLWFSEKVFPPSRPSNPAAKTPTPVAYACPLCASKTYNAESETDHFEPKDLVGEFRWPCHACQNLEYALKDGPCPGCRHYAS